MSNHHDKIIAFHDEKVTLPQDEQKEMRKRRDSNRNRIKEKSRLVPSKFESQGSYAMHTMVQQSEKDYDIDDGAYFDEEALGNKIPRDVKQEVCDALQDQRFNTPPEVRKKCVRVYYNEGYHVDVPIYREISKNGKIQFELATDKGWEESDPSQVTSWFREVNKEKSPDEANGMQLRRITRLLKYFARSREDWCGRMATGLMITKLVVDYYQSADSRDDESLKKTMISIKDALAKSLEIDHPVIEGEKLTNGPNDPKTSFFLDKLNWAIRQLEGKVDELEAWDVIFDARFFCDEPSDGNDPDGGSDNSGSLLEMKKQPTNPVNKRGGGTYA